MPTIKAKDRLCSFLASYFLTRVLSPQVKSDFLAMLSESETIHERSQWRKVKSSFDHDPRYKAVEDSGTREEWFSEHVQSLANKVCLTDSLLIPVYAFTTFF